MMNVIDIWMDLNVMLVKILYMQRDEILLHINNGKRIDAIQTSYRKTGDVYTHRSGLV